MNYLVLHIPTLIAVHLEGVLNKKKKYLSVETDQLLRSFGEMKRSTLIPLRWTLVTIQNGILFTR